MTIDNVTCDGVRIGGFLSGDHGAVNQLDAVGKQHGLTSSYYFQGDRHAVPAVIAFLLAYVGNHGNVTPIKTFAFDVSDDGGNLVQHVEMADCRVTAWALHSPVQPDDPNAPVRPDVE